MKGQCMAFFLAGYETTSTALALLTYQLAKNPRVQEKLQAELDEHYPDKVVITEKVNKTKFSPCYMGNNVY